MSLLARSATRRAYGCYCRAKSGRWRQGAGVRKGLMTGGLVAVASARASPETLGTGNESATLRSEAVTCISPVTGKSE